MIYIKTKEEIEVMAQGGKILAKIMREIKNRVEPGIRTKDLDKLASELIFKFKAKPSFKNYKGFPAALCVAINHEIVHGVPSDRILKQGDIIGLDLGILYPANSAGGQGFHADMAVTCPVGSISPEANRLIRVTKKALKRAIARTKPGKTIGDISHAIQKYVQDQDFQVIRQLVGHGIGRALHEGPEVPNFGQRHKGEILKPGMVLAIEPMTSIGQPGIKKGPDGFVYQTADNSLSAHFEHTVAVTEKGPKVLTE